MSTLLGGQQLLDCVSNFLQMKKKWRKNRSNKLKTLPKADHELAIIKERCKDQLAKKFDFLGLPRSRLSNDIGKATWINDLRIACLDLKKKVPSWMGIKKDGMFFLSPEETLFLIEIESIILKHEDVPLSLDAAYKLILKDEASFKAYRVYSYFARLGYRIKKFTTSKCQDFKILNDFGESHERASKKMKLSDVQSTSCSKTPQISFEPLKRNMFLQNSSLNKANFENDGKNFSMNSSNSFTDSGVVLTIKPFVHVNFQNLPCSPLLSEDLTPLVNQTQILTIQELEKILTTHGPKEHNSDISLTSSFCDFSDFIYEIYFPETKSISSESPQMLLVISSSDDYPPSSKELEKLKGNHKQAEIIVAVFHALDFSLYSLSNFVLWNETPSMWEQQN